MIVEAMNCELRVDSKDCVEGIHDIPLENRYGTIFACNDKVYFATAISKELTTYFSAQDQVNGDQRFLPHVVAEQFLAAMR